MKYRIAIIWIAKKCYVILTHPGFIPVFTENMSTLPQYYLGDPVYPCVYREHNIIICVFGRFLGLSLCVQGTLRCYIYKTLSSRFIPVCTGNTIGIANMGSDAAVYPCVYREHWWAFSSWYIIYGLSLCVQGTHSVTRGHLKWSRFIPVCTGNTARPVESQK